MPLAELGAPLADGQGIVGERSVKAAGIAAQLGAVEGAVRAGASRRFAGASLSVTQSRLDRASGSLAYIAEVLLRGALKEPRL